MSGHLPEKEIQLMTALGARKDYSLTVEAVSVPVVARHRVLDVDVRRALAAEAGAHLGQVALVLGLAARVAGGEELQT